MLLLQLLLLLLRVLLLLLLLLMMLLLLMLLLSPFHFLLMHLHLVRLLLLLLHLGLLQHLQKVATLHKLILRWRRRDVLLRLMLLRHCSLLTEKVEEVERVGSGIVPIAIGVHVAARVSEAVPTVVAITRASLLLREHLGQAGQDALIQRP